MAPRQPVVLSPSDLSNVIIRAKYYLWNFLGRPFVDPHTWLIHYLDGDLRRERGRTSNLTKFRRACKHIYGRKVQVTLADIWRNLAIYHVVKKRHGNHILSDDESSSYGDN